MEWEKQDAREGGGSLLPSNDGQSSKCWKKRLRKTNEKP